MPQVFVAQQFLDSLVSMDDKGEIHPWLAKSWAVSADGMTYTFHLQEDVKFTHDEKFTSEAVKANLDQYGESGRTSHRRQGAIFASM